MRMRNAEGKEKSTRLQMDNLAIRSKLNIKFLVSIKICKFYQCNQKFHISDIALVSHGANKGTEEVIFTISTT